MENIINNPILGCACHRILLDDTGKPYDYEFLEVNATFEKVTGLKRENLIGKTAREAIPGLERSEFDWIGYYGDIALNGGAKEFEQFSEPLGRWYQVYAYSTEKLFFTTLFNDITESKKQSEELEGFFDVTLDLFCIADKEGYLIKTNKAWREILGYSAEELNTHKFSEFVHSDDLEATLEAMARLGRGEGVLHFTNRYRGKDGSYRYFEWRSHPKGNLIYAAARDVTGRIQAEEGLKTQRNRLAGIIEGTRSGTWEWNVQTGETIFNERWAEIIGYTLEEINPVSIETWTKFAHPEDIKVSGEQLEKHFHGELDYYESESRMRHKNGEWIWVLDRGKVVLWTDGGKPLLMMGTHQDITDRKRMENALRQSEERLGLAMAVKNEGVWDWNLVTNRAFFDERYYTMAGYEAGEFPQDFASWAARVHPNDLPGAEAAIQACLSGASDCFDIEFRFKRKDESWMWIQGRGKIVERDEAGAPLRIIGTHTDITERKRAEEELREIEERFHTFFNLPSAGFAMTTAEGKWIHFNDKLSQMLGYSRDEFAQKTWMELTPFEDLVKEMELFAEVINGVKSDSNLEKRYISKEGTLLDVSVTTQVVRNPDGSVAYFTSIIQDITERKRAEEALRESEAKLSALFASMTEMVVLHELVFDEAGAAVNYRITDCNTAFTRITGIRCEDAVGRLANELYGTPEPPFLEVYSRVGITGEPYHYETYFPPLGKHFAISVVSPGPNRFATITADVSETMRIQRSIDAKNKELEQLVYVASHDLRSPLVNVDGFSRELDYALEELDAALGVGGDGLAMEKTLRAEIPNMKVSIGHIRSSARQMDELLKGLLKLSRFGRAAMQIADVDMNAVIGQLAASFAFTLQETGIELAVDDLPGCRGDTVQVKQVFSNLLDNAIKYRHPDRPGTIRIRGARKMDHVEYRVEDNGIGIAENHLHHIFELFHRLDPGKSEGEGLGLTIARQSLSRMFGEINVESQPGKGSAFIVILPLAYNRSGR